MKRMSKRYLAICFLLVMLISRTVSEVYQLPAVTSTEMQYIRLGSIHELDDEANMSLNKIYKREIYSYVPNQTLTPISQQQPLQQFAACECYPAQVQFDLFDYYSLDQNYSSVYDVMDSSSLVYDYQVLKSQYKNVVDMTYYSNHVFTISSTGFINVYRLDSRGIQFKRNIQAIDWDNLVLKRQQKLRQALENNSTFTHGIKEDQQLPESLKFHHIQEGYFELMEDNQLMLFCNGEVLIGLDVRTLKTTLLSEEKTISVNSNTDPEYKKVGQQSDENSIPNSNYSIKITREYQQLQNFQSVTKIDQNHFAVLDRKKGVIVYKINKSPHAVDKSVLNYEIEKIQTISKNRFGNTYGLTNDMNLVDIKFSKQKGLLLVLDYDHGVFAFDKAETQVDNNSSNPMFTLNSNIILKKQCNLMEYSSYGQNLYLTCSKVYRIYLGKWPLVSEKTFLHPMINIRQIYPLEEQNLLVFAGYSTFKLLYLDRQAEYFEDEMLDKILFYNGNKAITANEYAILAFDYKIDKPVVTCQTTEKAFLGEHNVVLKTTAECQEDFLESINRTKEMKSIHDPEDFCIYTVYKTLSFWEQGELPETTLVVFTILFAIFSILMILCILFNVFRVKRAKKYLESLAVESHVTLVEQTSQKPQKPVSQNDFSITDQAETGEPMNRFDGALSSDKQPQQKL